MAGKLRVHELAKQLGVTSKELLGTLQDQGEFVKSASSTIEPPVAKKMKSFYGVSDEKAAANAAGADTTKKAPATPSATQPADKTPAPSETKTPEPSVSESPRSEDQKSSAPTPAAPKPSAPKPAAPKVANNPFSSAPTPAAPKPQRPSGDGNAAGGRGGRPQRPQGGSNRRQNLPERSSERQGGGRRPSPGSMSQMNPGAMPTSNGAPGGGFGGPAGRGGGPRGNRGGSSTRRGGNAGGAFGNRNGGAGRGRKSKRQKRNEYEAMQAPTVVGGVQLPNGKGAEIRLARGASLADFAEKINAESAALVQALFNLGEMVTATQSVSDETLMLLGEEMDYKVQVISPEDEDRELLERFDLQYGEDEGDDDNLEQRPPVVTVMGHVDHGKTRLLDTIRHENVGGEEAGGITQNIGAYQVEVDQDGDTRLVTFLDTPGHEAFTAMRARGAEATDIAILVVAADDGVMPQTIEAINHAKAAGTPIVVAVNKIDKESASPDKIRGQLTEYDLIPEEYGGTTQFVDISAKQGTNIDQLLEAVLLTADAELDLRANPEMDAQGVVIEAHLDRGRGPVATVLVQRGTLHVGDSIIAGDSYGRVRRMIDEHGNDVAEAAPSRPVQVLGLTSVCGAGDSLLVVEEDRTARQIADRRNALKRNAMEANRRKRVSLEDLDEVLKETSTLNLILKSDNAGAVEALEEALLKIDVGEDVALDIVDRGVGAVTETNVNLAATSDAVIIGFNVRAEGKATEVANAEGVQIRYYNVIYRAIEDIEAALKGMLKPIYEEREIGRAEIRALFKASSVGTIAGSMVESGKMRRNAQVRLLRDGAVIAENAKIESLRREKDDVTEVSAGYECGMVLSYPDIQVGDIIEAYELVEIPRT